MNKGSIDFLHDVAFVQYYKGNYKKMRPFLTISKDGTEYKYITLYKPNNLIKKYINNTGLYLLKQKAIELNIKIFRNQQSGLLFSIKDKYGLGSIVESKKLLIIVYDLFFIYSDKITTEYLYYYLKGCKYMFDRISTGTTRVKGFTLKKFRNNIKIYYPEDKKEQIKITTALSRLTRWAEYIQSIYNKYKKLNKKELQEYYEYVKRMEMAFIQKLTKVKKVL